MTSQTTPFAALPAVHDILNSEEGCACVEAYGHDRTLAYVREGIEGLRAALLTGEDCGSRVENIDQIAAQTLAALRDADRTNMRRVFNMTGTILHTNLGRAAYSEAAVAAATEAMRHPLALEFDLDKGRRGQRDDTVQKLVAEITGAEDACLVNNNASAVLLVLAALAGGKETVVSRGELIEIGGSFRMPDVMEAAGTRLREVGTTNRTHLKDYRAVIGPDTGLLMKVHTSNYKVMGFTKETSCADLAGLARETGVPLVDDLGSGVLVDLSTWGVARERTVQEALAEGADLVTFSGDKLLGGPQAGFIAGRRDLVRACASHPLKRALRLDKVRLAALEATLKLYRRPDMLDRTLPTMRHFARGMDEMQTLAEAVLPPLQAVLGAELTATAAPSQAQIGSGALPLETLPSLAIRIAAPGQMAEHLALAFRRLPVPVIGRIEKGALWLDLRCLDDAQGFIDQLDALPALIAADR